MTETQQPTEKFRGAVFADFVCPYSFLAVEQIDRLARIMDSAISLPILGRVGLDAVLDLIPGVGNLAGAAVSLMLIARTLPGPSRA